ncbi:MAG: hypothetical protein P8130_03885 [Deltaproteobacteria bacterium]
MYRKMVVVILCLVLLPAVRVMAKAMDVEKVTHTQEVSGTSKDANSEEVSGTSKDADAKETARTSKDADAQEGSGTSKDADAKELSGMSIVGNDEAPKSLYIVPWKSSEIGKETSLDRMLSEGAVPVDRDVFMRQLDFYEISTAK